MYYFRYLDCYTYYALYVIQNSSSNSCNLLCIDYSPQVFTNFESNSIQSHYIIHTYKSCGKLSLLSATHSIIDRATIMKIVLYDKFTAKCIFLCNVWFISYGKCSNWRLISKSSSNFGCLFTLDGANSKLMD